MCPFLQHKKARLLHALPPKVTENNWGLGFRVPAVLEPSEACSPEVQNEVREGKEVGQETLGTGRAGQVWSLGHLPLHLPATESTVEGRKDLLGWHH